MSAEHKRRESVTELPEDERPASDEYKVAKKVALDDLVKQDTEDESLNKYKKSLLGAAADGKIPDDPNDPRQVIVKQIEVLVDGREPIVFDPNDPTTKDRPYTLKEGVNYRLKVTFRVQRDIVLGLKFMNFVYKHKVRVDKSEEMLGSYGPGQEYEFVFQEESAPSGMLARGNYTAKSRFVDDDANVHLEYEYAFHITKEWDN